MTARRALAHDEWLRMAELDAALGEAAAARQREALARQREALKETLAKQVGATALGSSTMAFNLNSYCHVVVQVLEQRCAERGCVERTATEWYEVGRQGRASRF